jgi:hypothetical protein
MTIPIKPRKSSTAVKLVLIGTIGTAVGVVAGCSGNQERRDIYANRDACLSDWGNEAKDCTPVAANSSTRTGSSFGTTGNYYGRSYDHISGETGPRSARAIGSAVVGRGGVSSSPGSSVSRGGFGSSGRSASG